MTARHYLGSSMLFMIPPTEMIIKYSSVMLNVISLLLLSFVRTSSHQQVRSEVLISCCRNATTNFSRENSNSFHNDLNCDYYKLVNLNKKLVRRKPIFIAELQKKITFSMISYCTIDILDYSTIAYAINSAYAEYRGYDMHLFSSMIDTVYEIRDHRWDRVKLIHDLLMHPIPYDYYVWFDADLIIQHFSFRFEDVIAQYPNASIIISAERHAETGVANTGRLDSTQ